MTTETITTIKVQINDEVLDELKYGLEDGQITIHCEFTADSSGTAIRIWPTTYLISNTSEESSEMVHAENIPLMPQWKHVPPNTKIHFTIIFPKLSDACNNFSIIEFCANQGGGFHVSNITRNKNDIYHITII